MKFLPAQLAYFLQNHEARRNVRLLLWFLVLLAAMIVTYSVVFHFLMAAEGQEHSWMSGLYWTLVVMTTLGFGDITFQSDIGRAFSVLVLISGVLFLLVVLPFAFIQFFLAPWLEAQSRARAPRELPDKLEGHVLLTNYDPVTENLISRLERHNFPYALIVRDLRTALNLYDMGVRVVLGELDDPETYRKCRVESARMVVATSSDPVNTSVTFTVREVTETVPVITNADSDDSLDILQLAGSTHVLQLKTMLGRFLARRTVGMSSRVNMVGHFGDLYIAEASAMRSPLVGKTVADARLREATGITVVGLWERGKFTIAQPDSVITSATVLILVGTQEQLQAYDELFCIYVVSDAPAIILGGGRVGMAAARALEEREIDYRIVEQDPSLANRPKHIVGSAADLATLEQAGLRSAGTVIVTTSDDDTNVYLTIYCRRLCPDIQIISRANFEKNITTLHRAGADFVMSFASMGASTILNILQGEEVLMFAEGLNIFRMKVPARLAGVRLRDSDLRQKTGCNVVAIEATDKNIINPSPDTELAAGDDLILIGDSEAEERVLQIYPDSRRENGFPAGNRKWRMSRKSTHKTGDLS